MRRMKGVSGRVGEKNNFRMAADSFKIAPVTIFRMAADCEWCKNSHLRSQ